MILYNGDEYPADCARENVRVLARRLPRSPMNWAVRAPHMIMLGALLEIIGVLRDVNIDAALKRLVKNPRFTEMNQRALARGRQLARIPHGYQLKLPEGAGASSP